MRVVCVWVCVSAGRKNVAASSRAFDRGSPRVNIWIVVLLAICPLRSFLPRQILACLFLQTRVTPSHTHTDRTCAVRLWSSPDRTYVCACVSLRVFACPGVWVRVVRYCPCFQSVYLFCIRRACVCPVQLRSHVVAVVRPSSWSFASTRVRTSMLSVTNVSTI